MSMLPNHTTLSQRCAESFSIVAISDLHLCSDASLDFYHCNPSEQLAQVLALIRQSYAEADLMVVLGDLLQEPSLSNYQDVFARLDTVGLDYVALAGNHDVTLELDSHLPFLSRRHLPVERNEHLVNCWVLHTPYWDLLFLDSSVKGQVYGEFSAETLAWLSKTLADSDKYCAIFAHHPMAKIHSAWIDQHFLRNASDFWQIVIPHREQVKGVFAGHVHQEAHILHEGISLFTTPATSIQFLPFSATYALDSRPAGLRWLTLYNNGTLATGVKRIDTM